MSGAPALDRIPATAREWEHAYTAYAPRLRRYFHRRIGPAADAEDLTQETFLWAMTRRYDYRTGPGALPGWLLGCIAPAVLAAYGRGRWSQQQAARGEATRLATATNTTTPAATLPGVLADAVGALPTCQRRAVELIYLEGQQVKTTAAVLDRTRQTVGFHRNDALATLRHSLHHTRAS